MPYETIADLPQSVRAHLPEHAQEIYVAAFNNAWEHSGKRSHRRAGASREETAHRVAWAAVKASYVKRADGHWKRRKLRSTDRGVYKSRSQIGSPETCCWLEWMLKA